MTTFGDILAEFKKLALGEAENIVPIMDNETLVNGLIAWKSVKVTYKQLTECTETDDTARWEWLWKNVDFDMTMFATVAGVKAQDASSLFFRLKGLRLIYPDGTINVLAKQYLQAQIMTKIRSATKTSREKPQPESAKS
jgi:hypothetical protein